MATKLDAEEALETLGLTTIEVGNEDVDEMVGTEEGDGSDEDAREDADGHKAVGKPKESKAKTGKKPAKEDPSRLEYWQARADKMQEKLKAFETLAPIARLIGENPEVLEVIEKTVEAKRNPPEPELKKPERPVKPADFDETASLTDPESPSFKYRKQLADYQEQFTEYTEKREEQRERREKQRLEREKQALQHRSAEQTLRTQLRGQGFSDEMADDFIKVMGSPESVSIENLVELYRIRTGKAVKPGKTQRKNNDVLLPVGAEGGGETTDESEPDEEETFNLSMVGAVKDSRVVKRFTPLSTSSVFRR